MSRALGSVPPSVPSTSQEHGSPGRRSRTELPAVPSTSNATSSTGRGGSKRMTPWGNRRHTPYHKTPQTRNLRGTAARGRLTRTPVHTKSKSSSSQIETEQTPEFELASKTWRIYKVSPLFNFSYNLTKLKQLQKILATYVQVETKKGIAVSVKLEDEVANAAVIEPMEGLRLNQADPEAVKIVLKQKKTSVLAEKTVLTAILCSVGVDESMKEKVDGSHFTYLPVMLVKGAVSLTTHLHMWMKTVFDCYISPVTFSHSHMSWMLAMWAGYLPGNRGAKKVQLVYSIPASVPSLSNITLSVNAEQCYQLWKGIHKEDDEEFKADEVVAFIKSLEHHFFHHFKIHLDALSLRQIGTPIAFVAKEGKLKMYSKAHMLQVLGLITELTVEQSWLT